MHGFEYAEEFLNLALFTLIFSMSFWFRDVISEGTYLGNDTLAVQRGLNMGVGLFLSSPAKPHAFVSLPVQSSIFNKNVLKTAIKNVFTPDNLFILFIAFIVILAIRLCFKQIDIIFIKSDTLYSICSAYFNRLNYKKIFSGSWY